MIDSLSYQWSTVVMNDQQSFMAMINIYLTWSTVCVFVYFHARHLGTLFLRSSHHFLFKNITLVWSNCKFYPSCICVFVYLYLCICMSNTWKHCLRSHWPRPFWKSTNWQCLKECQSQKKSKVAPMRNPIWPFWNIKLLWALQTCENSKKWAWEIKTSTPQHSLCSHGSRALIGIHFHP